MGAVGQYASIDRPCIVQIIEACCFGMMNIMRVYRLEFLQPDGRWTGPYCAEWMTPKAFELREKMLQDHNINRPYPISETFARNPGKDRYVCASPSWRSLQEWFGKYLLLYLKEGGHIGVYNVPEEAIAEKDKRQIVYQQKGATYISREGSPIDPSLLICKIHPSKKTAAQQI
jgi:hypothetical protein